MHDYDLHPSHWLNLMSPQRWLAMGACSMVLAFISSSVLISRLEKSPAVYAQQWYDQAERFTLETIRLSFTNRRLVKRDESVFVAPKGILDKDAVFNWVAADLSLESKVENQAADPVAPARILDPEWEPDFALVTDKRKSR